MDTSSAYQFGQLLGMIIAGVFALAFFIGGPVFTVISIVKAFKTRRTGWIISAVVTSLIGLGMLGCFVLGVVAGVKKQIADKSRPVMSAQVMQQLLDVPMDEIVRPGYAISLPEAGKWATLKVNPDMDKTWIRNGLCVATIPESEGCGSPEGLKEIAESTLRGASKECDMGEAREVTIDGKKWLSFDAQAKISFLRINYRFFVYSDDERSMQVIFWVNGDNIESVTPVIERIISSFRFLPMKPAEE